MKIALIGASGLIGSRVLDEAVGRGHAVTAICRDPNRIASRPGMTPAALDVFDRSALKAVLQGHDAVVSCYSSGHVFDPARNGYLETMEAAVGIIAATKVAGARLLFVGGAGSLKDADGVALIDQLGYPEATMGRSHPAFLRWLATLPAPAYDPEAQPRGAPYIGGPDYVPALVRVKLILEHDHSFAWSFFSPPPALVPGDPSGRYQLGGDRIPLVDGLYATLTTGDAALALVDELDQRRHDWMHWTAYADA